MKAAPDVARRAIPIRSAPPPAEPRTSGCEDRCAGCITAAERPKRGDDDRLHPSGCDRNQGSQRPWLRGVSARRGVPGPAIGGDQMNTPGDPFSRLTRRVRVGALVASMLLLIVTVPGPAVGLRTVSALRSPGCPGEVPAIAGATDVLGVRMRTDDACRDAVRLMASFHACLRAGGERSPADPQGRPATGYHEADHRLH